MGQCVGVNRKQIDRDITKQLKEDARKMSQQAKLLLLGCGESGKSTFFRQICAITGNLDLDEEALTMYRTIIYNNIVCNMKELLDAAEMLGHTFETKKLARLANKIKHLEMNNVPTTPTPTFSKILEEIAQLWQDPGLKLIFENRGPRYSLCDSAAYFFDSIDRIKAQDYSPTVQDIVRCRLRTTGIVEREFDYNGWMFKMMDVGGQRNERRKWIHCFEDVTAVLFFVSLSEYDEVMRECEGNRLRESMILFEEIVNSKWFQRSNIILLFNKKDLFAEKLQRVPLQTIFPNYAGQSLDDALRFIKNRFLELVTNSHTVYCHFTCAVDPEDIEFVFKAVRDTMIKGWLVEQ